LSTETGLFLIADFNIDPLARILRHRLGPDVSVTVAPYNQVYQSLRLPDDRREGCGVVWVRPESTLPSFAAALDLAPADHEECVAEVDTFAEVLLQFASHCRQCLVASWTLPPGRRGYGMLDWKPNLGLASLMARLNLRLAERLGSSPDIHVLDSGRWLAANPEPASKMWFAAKVPYATPVFEAAAADVQAALVALTGKSRRLVVVDLDNTLWGGVLGETGWQGVRLGGHDYAGEAYVAFQRALKVLSRRGIQLAVASKNDERVALAAFDDHPEMVLRRADLAGWRIDWNDKAANIALLADELNLGLSSVVFIDDSPHERARVRAALPDVLVPDWPLDPCQYADALLALDCFDTPALGGEDRRRTSMYAAERSRREARASVPLEEWLRTLGTTIIAKPLGRDNVVRACQLLNKTNQLNMATRRLTERELLNWVEMAGRSVVTLSVSDAFGNMGLCGIIGVAVVANEALMTDFVLSCRVMGRGIEQTMIHLAVLEASRLGAKRLLAQFVPTDRNHPCLEILRASRLVESVEFSFTWDCRVEYEKPTYVAVIRDCLTSGFLT
jgi:FkbH-like protein